MAKNRGLTHESEDDLVDALFSDGFSTAESVSDTSGRGVGMSAVRDATGEHARAEQDLDRMSLAVRAGQHMAQSSAEPVIRD
jgi:hypothetical protein